MVIYLMNLLCDLNPIIQALIAGTFTLLITTLGSGVVFFFKDLNKYIMDSMLSISAGIMMSASFFSLLLPAMELSNKVYSIPWLILFIGFFTGGFLLYIGDKILDYFFIRKETTEKLSFKRCFQQAAQSVRKAVFLQKQVYERSGSDSFMCGSCF